MAIAWIEKVEVVGKAWDWLGDPHCSLRFHICGFPAYFPSSLRILLNPLRIDTAPGLLCLRSPGGRREEGGARSEERGGWRLSCYLWGDSSRAEVPNLMLPGAEKRERVLGLETVDKNSTSQPLSPCLSRSAQPARPDVQREGLARGHTEWRPEPCLLAGWVLPSPPVQRKLISGTELLCGGGCVCDKGVAGWATIWSSHSRVLSLFILKGPPLWPRITPSCTDAPQAPPPAWEVAFAMLSLRTSF